MCKISFVIPAYNEVAVIRKTIRQLRKTFPHAEVIISDDGSADTTPEACRSMGVFVLRQRHMGYASAVLRGIRAANGDRIVIMDANAPFSLDELKEILEKPFAHDVLVCSRVGYTSVAHGFFRAIRSVLYSLLVKKLFSIEVCDINGVKIVLRSALNGVKMRGSCWIFGAELLYKFKQKGRKISQTRLTFIQSNDNKSHLTIRSLLTLCAELLKLRVGLL